jgi:CheY-like chemotaxis protein
LVASIDEGRATGPQILVIDDDPDIRGMLTMLLARRGYEVEAASDGLTALERLRTGAPPSLILLDMMMPKMDGEAFMRAMRASAATCDMPVVILSGNPMARAKALELGAASCLVKPVELRDLFAAVDDILRPPRPVAP